MRVLSLGWGVQSFTLAAMAALGEIPPLEAAIHADTRHERGATYQFASLWSHWLTAHGVTVMTVRATITSLLEGPAVMIPAFTRDDRSDGQIKRQCTHDWKIMPIRRWLRDNRAGRRVTLLMGISLDEVSRMRDSDVRYVQHEYPLVDLRMTRADCVSWLRHQGLPVPIRSACVFCPYQSHREWNRLWAANGSDWQQATGADADIRMHRPPRLLYLHPSRRPLVDLDLRSEPERGQLSLWENECSGLCNT